MEVELDLDKGKVGAKRAVMADGAKIQSSKKFTLKYQRGTNKCQQEVIYVTVSYIFCVLYEFGKTVATTDVNTFHLSITLSFVASSLRTDFQSAEFVNERKCYYL